MAAPTKTLDAVQSRALGYLRTAFEGLPLGTKRFLGRWGRALSLALWSAQKAVEDVYKDIVPAPTNSSDALGAWMFDFGLPDGQGGYGFRLAVAASGGAASIAGVNATSFLLGATATAEDGVTKVNLSAAVTIPGTAPGYGSVAASFNAVTTGSAGNLPAGTVLTWDNPPPGADASFTLTNALSGGLDIETNPAGYSRLAQRLQTPPQGGTAEDIREWEESVTAVVMAYVYPLRRGLGTCDTVIVGGGSNQSRVPAASVLSAAQAAIDSHTPCGAQSLTAMLPVIDGGHQVYIAVTPSLSRYKFDWSGASPNVSSYTGGASPSLVLAGLAPASLKAAIDAYNANPTIVPPPRLQVVAAGLGASIGVPSVNPPVYATGHADSGGNTTLTLSTVPASFVAPIAGDSVYPYGPLVAPVAAAIQAVCDGLGPSRASGLGDPITPWKDTLTISDMIVAAASVVDVDGTPMVSEVDPSVAIDHSVADVEAQDGPLGPGLLCLGSVIVVLN